MTQADVSASKDHRGENFPVASFLLTAANRAPIMAFYRFARAADDVADSAVLTPDDKLERLERMRSALAGEPDGDGPGDDPGRDLRLACVERGLEPVQGLDILEAFRRDATQTRYADWDALMDYCRWSAAPVGRFVLDVHGEDRARTWGASDALCAALQVINHLQDCGKDRRELDRVYLPTEALAAEGLGVEALDAPSASPALRRVIRGLVDRTQALLERSRPFASLIADRRLALEVAVIQRLAEDLCARLRVCDPLGERVHHSKLEMARLAARAGADVAFGRGRRAGAA